MENNFKNYMEEVVEKMINELIKDIDVCKCEICHNDIKALALNDLAPKYVASKRGEKYIKMNYLDIQFETDAMASIIKSAQVVNNRRRHD